MSCGICCGLGCVSCEPERPLRKMDETDDSFRERVLASYRVEIPDEEIYPTADEARREAEGYGVRCGTFGDPWEGVRVPVVGDLVVYILPNGPHALEARPAIVISETEEPMRPELAVFCGRDGSMFSGYAVVRPRGYGAPGYRQPADWGWRSWKPKRVNVDPETGRSRR